MDYGGDEMIRSLGRAIGVLGITAALAQPSTALAQLYSEIPGLTSASVPYVGRSQSRIDFDLLYHRTVTLPGGEWGAEARLAYGRSTRIFANGELGFDFSLANGAYLKRSAADQGGSEAFLGGHAVYGFRVAGKYRLLSTMTPWREGVEIAAFSIFQPGMRTGISIIKDGDETWSGGLFRSPNDEQSQFDVFHVPSSWTAGLALGYRSTRLALDAELAYESTQTADNPVMAAYDGLYPRVGIMYRLTPGFAAGAAYWGGGSPPWSGQGSLPGVERMTDTFGAVLTLGGREGAGTDLVFASSLRRGDAPIRLFIRARTSS
jgi:hypothetical protein